MANTETTRSDFIKSLIAICAVAAVPSAIALPTKVEYAIFSFNMSGVSLDLEDGTRFVIPGCLNPMSSESVARTKTIANEMQIRQLHNNRRYRMLVACGVVGEFVNSPKLESTEWMEEVYGGKVAY